MHGNCESIAIATDKDITVLTDVVRNMDPLRPRLDDLRELHRVMDQYPSPLDATAVLPPGLQAALLRLITAYPQPPASEVELVSWQLHKALLQLFGPGAD